MRIDTNSRGGRIVGALDAAVWTIAAALCFVLVQKLGTYHTTVPDSLDGGWQVAMQFAWLNGLQSGRDIVFPHGPYGAFYAQTYHPDLVGLWYLIRIAHALAIAVAAVWVLRVRSGGAAWQRWLASGLAVVACAATVPGPDAIWMLPSFLLIGLALDDRDTPAGLLILLVLAIALATLAKFSFLVMGVTALVAWSVAAAVRRDRLALLALPFYALSVAVLWVAAGQDAGGFLDWTRTALEVGSGYGAAMSLTSHKSDLMVFAALVSVLLVGLWLEFRDGTPWVARGIILLGWLALFMFVAKAGFVRHDGHGVFPFEMAIAAATLVVARMIPPPPGLRLRFAAQVLVLVFAFGWLFEAHLRLMPGVIGVGTQIAHHLRFAPDHLLNTPNDLLSRQGKAAQYEAHAARSRDLLGGPHPRIAAAGSIDVHSYLIGPPILAGLPYHPRPVIQSYQSYTERLADRDVRHLRDAGAEVYVVHAGSIDNRPSLADGGPLWPEFLSLYDPVDVVPLGLLLERRETPAALTSATILEGESGYNTWVELPAPAPGSLIQVRGGIRPTLLGRAFTLVYKPPRITITLRRADGGEQTHRLIPGQLNAGFPISPILTTPQDLRTVFDGGTAGAPVVAFRINAAWQQRAFWGERFPLTVTELRRAGEG